MPRRVSLRLSLDARESASDVGKQRHQGKSKSETDETTDWCSSRWAAFSIHLMRVEELQATNVQRMQERFRVSIEREMSFPTPERDNVCEEFVLDCPEWIVDVVRMRASKENVVKLCGIEERQADEWISELCGHHDNSH